MNRILYASDCLKVLQARAALPDKSVDLIYLDPPFNSNSRYNLPFKEKYKTVRPVEAFNDTWHWTEEDGDNMAELSSNPRFQPLADVIRLGTIYMIRRVSDYSATVASVLAVGYPAFTY